MEMILLKDQFVNQDTVGAVSALIKKAYPSFKIEEFNKEILENIQELELKDRIFLVRDKLNKFLPNKFNSQVEILLNSLPVERKIADYIFAAYSDLVALNGCRHEYLDLSLSTLGELTKVFSAEFAIRDFINRFPEQTYNKMLEWARSLDVHQRRLASEGSRPNLPWGKSINFEYTKAIKILDFLYFDRERYVTRSVANHLNDVSKIDVDIVICTLKRWRNEQKQTNIEFDYICYHALRTLIKKGDENTLAFLGFNLEPKLQILNFTIDNDNISINESLEIGFDILAERDENLLIDYLIIYPMKNNKFSQKVFKLKKVKLKKNTSISIKKKHAFRKMSTRVLYSGRYELRLQINGKIWNKVYFNLKNKINDS